MSVKSSITLTQRGTEVDTLSQTLNFNGVTNRSFALTGGGNITIGNSFVLNYATNYYATGANESHYQTRNLALVLTGSNLPEDFQLKVGDKFYSRNMYGQYIIPLGDIQNAGNGSISVTAISDAINSACTLNAQLYTAGASNGARPFGENAKVAGPVSITVSAPAVGPGFKVISMSNRIINTDNLGQEETVRIKKANLSADAKVTMVVQIKDANGYVERTTALDLQTGLTAANGESTLTLRFNIAMITGNYRLLFTVTDGDIVMEIPYNFVVVD